MKVKFMSYNEIYTTALYNVLDEMRKVCPDVQHAFVYNEGGEIIAGDSETPQKVMARVMDFFDDIFERAEAIGGVETVTLNGSMGTVKLYNFSGHYFIMVYSAKADVGYIDTIFRVLIPTVLKVLEKLSPTPLKNTIPPPQPEQPPVEDSTPTGIPTEIPVEELKLELGEEEAKPPTVQEHKPFKETLTPLEVPAVQLIVENIGGLLVPSDTVRVDSETLANWENAFEGKKIEYVEIETFDGKTARYKVKPTKDRKYAGKGIVQIPEKAQLALEIKKGELVKVKPIIE
jgi:predicted regulator of Ras-like GTPase activity (Roadblock/LC7/MglB family)